MDIDWNWLFEKIKAALWHPFTAGIAGSLLALRWAPGRSWVERCLNVTSSIAIVWFSAPAVVDFFNIKTDSMACFMGFVIGCLGPNFFAKLYEGIKQTEVAGIIASYLKRG